MRRARPTRPPPHHGLRPAEQAGASTWLRAYPASAASATISGKGTPATNSAERRDRQDQRRRRVDDATAHPDDCGGDERDHGGPEAAHDPGDGRHLAVLDVDRAEHAEQDERRQDEQPAGRDRAADAVHRVADVGGELLRLGPGKRHAEVERVQEAALRDPAPPLDELVVHDRDLPGRPAEADHPELQPEAECLAFTRLRRRCRPDGDTPGRLDGRVAAHAIGFWWKLDRQADARADSARRPSTSSTCRPREPSGTPPRRRRRRRRKRRARARAARSRGLRSP